MAKACSGRVPSKTLCLRQERKLVSNTFWRGTAGSTIWDLIPLRDLRCSVGIALVFGEESGGFSQLCPHHRTGSGLSPALTTQSLLTFCLSGATLNPGRDARPGSAQPPTPPSREGALKLPLDKAGLPKPGSTPLAAAAQCAAGRELVSPAEAPVILSSPRTSKTDSYDLVWRPRPDSRAPILYYVVKHRKVAIAVLPYSCAFFCAGLQVGCEPWVCLFNSCISFG